MKTSKLDLIFKVSIVLALFIFALILIQDIIIPILFAALFSLVLMPLVIRLELKLGRVLSIVVVLFSAFIAMALITWFIAAQISALVSSLPDLQHRFFTLVNDISNMASTKLEISTTEQANLLKEGLTTLSKYISTLVSSTTYLLYFFVQVPIYIFLFLLYREKFRDFFIQLGPRTELSWLNEIEGVVRGYIFGLTIVVLIAGALNSIGLALLGIEHAIFFGFLSGALTVIPYVGISIGASLPALYVILTKDSLWYVAGVIAIHAFVQFLEGNFITPKVTGSRISINAMAAIISLLIGGKILGIPGMILAVPFTGVLRILLSFSGPFKPLAGLLDDNIPKKTNVKDIAQEKDEIGKENETSDT